MNGEVGKTVWRCIGVVVILFYLAACQLVCSIVWNAIPNWTVMDDMSPEGHHRKDYDQVAGLVEEGKLCTSCSGDCSLPQEYEYLSEFGEVWIDRSQYRISVFFWRSVGILGEGWGYVYRSDDSPPEEVIWCDEWERLERPYWFRCVSN